MTKLEELKAAYAASTQGEWVAPGFNSQGGEVACLLANHDGLRLVSGNFKRPDAKFIALAHNLMPTLLEAIDLLETVSSARACQDHEFDVDAWFKQVRSLLGNLK